MSGGSSDDYRGPVDKVLAYIPQKVGKSVLTDPCLVRNILYQRLLKSEWWKLEDSLLNTENTDPLFVSIYSHVGNETAG